MSIQQRGGLWGADGSPWPAPNSQELAELRAAYLADLQARTAQSTQACHTATQEIIREIRKLKPLMVVTEYDGSGEFVVGFEENWTNE